MASLQKPFWEHLYADECAPSAFGRPSDDIVGLLPELPPFSRVLDLGAGDGRNGLFLAAAGHLVTAVDISTAAMSKLNSQATRQRLSINTVLHDLCTYQIQGEYELVIAHGCLHLLPETCRDCVLREMKRHTASDGYNVVAVFTNSIPPPDDLRPWTIGLFTEGELFDIYSDWSVREKSSYVLEDEHPGGIRHRHSINRLIAQRTRLTQER